MYDPEPLRIFLVGSRAFGCAVRDLILHRAGVVLVGVCAPSGDPLANSTVAPAVHTDAPAQAMLPAGTDLIIAAHNHRYLPQDLLAGARLGGLSYHPSLLPLHRGRDAIHWTIRDRDRVAGGTVYWLDERIDGGDIAAQEWCFIRPDDTTSTLWRRALFPMGLRLIDQVISDLLMGHIIRRPQDEVCATWEPALTKTRLAQE
jgi:methionyl-tRNA formyltransferase